MNNGFRKDKDYWDRKLANYLHDPPDKALKIQGHEHRSDRLRDVLGDLPSPDQSVYKTADQIASGMDRTPLPGYSSDETRNGAINFIKDPVLTHPTGKNGKITLNLSNADLDIKNIQQAMAEIIRKDLYGDEAAHPGVCSFFKGDPVGLAAARFHYFHHVFRDRLMAEDVGRIGGLWHRLPADTRIPDHSIWQHCALVSALCSCIEGSKQRQASLMVFSITPVQDFIARARKLRDFWSGSLILSWLAFEGIREIVYSMGSDHLIYPSLVGQPMMDRLLWAECGMSGTSWSEPKSTDVASFPNKFVFLVPGGDEADTAKRISERINSAWVDLGKVVLGEIEKRVGESDDYISRQFDSQMRHFFDFHWSASPLMDESKQNNFKKLLPEPVWRRPVDFVESTKHLQYKSRGYGAYYSISHALAQSFLAAGKGHRTNHRKPEKGIKCPLHGDLEILHFGSEENKNPRPEDDPFWKSFKSGWGDQRPDFKSSERLSSVAMVKRIAGIVLEDNKTHPLAPQFQGSLGFPSTTEIALSDWLNRVEENQTPMFEKLGATPKERRQALAQFVHEAEDPEYEDKRDPKEVAKLSKEQRNLCRQMMHQMCRQGESPDDSDKYFAVLMMDGDYMGKLINGVTLGSTWNSVIHPALIKRMAQSGFDERYRTFWLKHGADTRLISPAVHAAISEALGDFSLHTVPAIVEKHKGRLIYAGGDDICAVFPVSSVLPAAREISDAYTKGFVCRPEGAEGIEAIQGEWLPKKEPLGVHLGTGDGISISAGVLIWHHKRPLAGAIRRANDLLKEQAKNQGGRNALAVELAKRAGGSRFFVCNWNQKSPSKLQLDNGNSSFTILDHFIHVAKAVSDGKRLSTSFLYRLESFRPGLEAIAENNPEGMVKFLPKQIKGEKAKEGDVDQLAAHITALLVRERKQGLTVETESLIIARFLAPLIARLDTEGRFA